MSVGRKASRLAAVLAACQLLWLPSVHAQTSENKPPSNPSARTLLIEEAEAFEARGRPDLSVRIWRQVLASDPKNTQAIAGLAQDLKLTGSSQSTADLPSSRKAVPVNPDLGIHAKQDHTKQDNDKPLVKTPAVAQKPEEQAPVLLQLDTDIALLESEISFYIATGQGLCAAGLMARVQAYYARLHSDAPILIAVENASLLFSTGNDRALYPALMSLGERSELTIDQRQTVEVIWVNWSIRRAAKAMEDGAPQRSIDILDAASQAFPGRVALHTSLAGAYAKAGRTADALDLYKTLPMQDAAAEDLERAIDAALTVGDNPQAQQWLQPALARFSRDPDLLSLASRYEQAIGDGPRAAEFYRASLAAMPSTPRPKNPSEELAHLAFYPAPQSSSDQNPGVRRPVTAADLPHLLEASDVPFAKTSYLPTLTAGLPPAQKIAPPPLPGAAEPAPQPASPPATAAKPNLKTRRSDPQDPPRIFPPSASQGQTPTAPIYSTQR
jgi:tetratricopeptide (TPR) repeat protein